MRKKPSAARTHGAPATRKRAGKGARRPTAPAARKAMARRPAAPAAPAARNAAAVPRDRAPFVPGGYPLRDLVGWELRQWAGDDGRDPASLSRLRAAAGLPDVPYNWSHGRPRPGVKPVTDAALLSIYRRALALPIRRGFPFTEPDDLEGIRSLRPAAETRRYPIPREDGWLYDRLLGAWLGRCAGCTLGGPAEQWRPDTRASLKRYLLAKSPLEWPITNYMPEESPCDVKIVWKRDATRERLAYVPADDDLTHTVIAQIALGEVQSPGEFRSIHLARTWYRFMPYVVTAGGASMLALRNLLIRYPAGLIAHGPAADADGAVDWPWVAAHSNPFREDIDGAIRADSYAYAAPGQPELAASLAWQDVRVSSVKTGIYCCMFYAAMIAAAFALNDPLAVVEAGRAEIPASSRLYAAIGQVIEICRRYQFRGECFEQVLQAIYETFGDDDCGTPNNMATIVAAVLLGDRDFEKVITFCVMGGFDSDSTAATAGSVAGAMLGAARLPEKWTRPLRDTLQGQIIGYHPIAVSECARRSLEIATRFGALG